MTETSGRHPYDLEERTHTGKHRVDEHPWRDPAEVRVICLEDLPFGF